MLVAKLTFEPVALDVSDVAPGNSRGTARFLLKAAWTSKGTTTMATSKMHNVVTTTGFRNVKTLGGLLPFPITPVPAAE